LLSGEGTKNKKTINAKYCVNGEEDIKSYDPELGKQYTVNCDEIAVEKRKHCFVLKRIRRDPENYINSFTMRFLIPIRLLKTQLAYSILQLFPTTLDTSFGSHSTNDLERHFVELHSELVLLASDSKLRRLVTDDFYKQIDKKYQVFIKFTK
jgi:hypothetical protein